MFSSRLLFLISSSTTINRYLGSSCLRYNKSTKLYSNDPSLYCKVRLNFLGLLFYVLAKFVLVFKLKKQGKLDEYHLNTAFSLGAGMVFAVFAIPAWFSWDYSNVFNGFLILYRLLQGAYMQRYCPRKSKLNWIIDIFIGSFMACVFVFNFVLCLSVIIFPRGPLSMGGLIPVEYFTFPVKIFVILLHCYWITLLNGNLATVGGNILAYLIYVTIFLSKELRLGRKFYLTDERLRSPAHIRHIYRSFQILHQNAMCFMGIFLVVCNGTFLGMPVYYNFVLIKYWAGLHGISRAALVLSSILTMGFWAILLEFGRKFFSRSTNVLGSWGKIDYKNHEFEKKVMKRFRKSCKPILLSYGKQFVVGRTNVLRYFKGIVYGTQKAILTLGKR